MQGHGEEVQSEQTHANQADIDDTNDTPNAREGRGTLGEGKEEGVGREGRGPGVGYGREKVREGRGPGVGNRGRGQEEEG